MARAVNGEGLPAHVLPFCIGGGALFTLLALCHLLWPHSRALQWTPSAVGVAVGMYVGFSLPDHSP